MLVDSGVKFLSEQRDESLLCITWYLQIKWVFTGGKGDIGASGTEFFSFIVKSDEPLRLQSHPFN